MDVFIVTFYKHIGGSCKNEGLWRKRLRLCEKDSDFLFAAWMSVLIIYMLKSRIYDTTSKYN